MYQLGDAWWSEPAPSVAPATSAGSVWSSIASGVKDLAPVLTQAYRERMILKAQLARAQQGLPPFEASQYSPPLRVDTTIGASSGTQKTMLALGVGALALGAVWLLAGKRRR